MLSPLEFPIKLETRSRKFISRNVVKSNTNAPARKSRPRRFELLEPRHALDGAALNLPASLPLPTTIMAVPAVSAAAITSETLPVMGLRVYAAPIGPAPAQAKPVTGTASASTTILPPLTLNAAASLGAAALPVGPARPATLPTPPAPPPTQPLYAEGVLPTNPTPANLPTTVESMPVVTDPPNPPAFTLVPSRPRL